MSSRSRSNAVPAKSAVPAKKSAAARVRKVAAGDGAAPVGRAPPLRGKGDPLPKLREVCLALPEATEKEAWGSPTFRVKDKVFVMFLDNHHHDGRLAIWCKAPLGMQESLVEADAARFFVPPYVGHQGWVGVRLEDDLVDWAAVESIVREGYRMAAPKRLAALVEGSGSS